MLAKFWAKFCPLPGIAFGTNFLLSSPGKLVLVGGVCKVAWAEIFRSVLSKDES